MRMRTRRMRRMKRRAWISCCKKGICFFPMPAPLLYTDIDTAKMCNAHSGLKRTTRSCPHWQGPPWPTGRRPRVAAVPVWVPLWYLCDTDGENEQITKKLTMFWRVQEHVFYCNSLLIVTFFVGWGQHTIRKYMWRESPQNGSMQYSSNSSYTQNKS